MKLNVKIFFVLLTCTFSCSRDNNSKTKQKAPIAKESAQVFRINDIRLFKNTPVWDLALAIFNHDIEEERRLLVENPNWINYQEPRFNASLLYWTVRNSPYYFSDEYESLKEYEDSTFYEEAKLLIEKGANPYYFYKSDETPFSAAANVFYGNKRFIELCLSSEHTINLNDSLKRVIFSEALISACGKIKEELDGVKLLVDSGADINYFNNDSTETPVSESLIHRNMDIATYLIIDQRARYNYNIKFMIDNSNWNVLEILRNLDFHVDSSIKNPIKEEILKHVESSY
jgi:hypothetical protein